MTREQLVAYAQFALNYDENDIFHEEGRLSYAFLADFDGNGNPYLVFVHPAPGVGDYAPEVYAYVDGRVQIVCSCADGSASGGYLEELKDNPNVILPDGSFNFDLIKTKPLQVQSKFKITNGINSSNFLIIKNEALEEIPPETYCVLTLNIKNRVLRNEDTNIFTSSFAFMTAQSIMDFYSFTLEQDNNNVKLKGSYTLKEGAGNSIGFYSPIIENYFNVSSTEVKLINTNGITSSSGKAVKFGIYKDPNSDNSKPHYILFLGYQDGSTLEAGDTITFNLTPDKNSTLDPVYSEVTNVQQMGEALNKKIESASYNEIRINEEFDTGKTINGKKVYSIIYQYSNLKQDLNINNLVYYSITDQLGGYYGIGMTGGAGGSFMVFYRWDLNGGNRSSGSLTDLVGSNSISGIIEYTKD